MKRVRKAFDSWWSRWSHKLQRVLVQLTPIIAFILIGLVYYLGIRTERTGFVAEVLDPNLKRITQPVLNAFRGRPPIVHRLEISLAQEHLDSLLQVRELALNEGWLYSEGNPRYPVSCALGEYVFDGVLNLRDGPGEAFALTRWPLQMRLSRGDTLFGMGAFNLMPVNDMAAVHSWLFQQALAENGQPAFRQALLECRFNRNDLGLYTVEGRTDSIVLQQWQRGPGPVIRFDDGLLAGATAALDNRLFEADPPLQGDWLVAPILVMNLADDAEDPAAARKIQTAARMLEDFRAGKRPASEVFHVPYLARLFALTDLLGGHATTEWPNLRFLADTVTERLIMIPLRAQAGQPIRSIAALQAMPIPQRRGSSTLQQRVYNDTAFFRHYIAYLDTLTRPGWVDSLLSRNRAALEDQQRIISAEYPQAQFDRSIFEHNRQVIDQTLRPKDLVLAYTRSMQGDQRRLAIANVHSIPVRAVGIISGGDTIPLAKPVLLMPREPEKPLSYTLINAKIPPNEGLPIRLLVHIPGLDEMSSVTIRTWSTFVAN